MNEMLSIIAFATPVLAAGGAWGAARAAIKEAQRKIERVDKTLERHVDDDDSVQRELLQRAAAVEAKIDIVLARMKQ